jgi:flavin reductase (DIM6/NTAB) family NADH-FMN oxidoreductase RutF
VWARYDGGDHTLFVGEVQDAAVNTDPDIKPLLFFASKYRKIAEDPL